MNPASQSQPVHLIVGNISRHSGISRYARELYRGLNGRIAVHFCSFRAPPLARRLTFLEHVPLGVEPDHRKGVYHFTRIMGCSLMLWRPVHPAVATVHDLGPLVWPSERPARVVDRTLLRLSLLGLRRMDRIVAVSHATARSLVERFGLPGERVRVVHEGVDRQHFQHQPDARRALSERFGVPQSPGVGHLLFVGNEAPRKNLGTLLKALAVLKERGLQVRLIKVGAAGHPRYRSAFLGQIRALGLLEDVLIVGEVAEADLPLFYGVADALILPSYVEGFGLPVLEAMACGTPVVCANAGAMPEVVGDAGILVGPQDPRGLAAAIACLLEDSTLHDRLVEAGLQRCQRFSWERTVEETMTVYDELLR
jgi:glycosyltransferase involved in cell wall biosynthesis